jgi:hypothetical protein
MTAHLVAIDLDGTLLNSQGQISAGNAEALRGAISAGIIVAPATARWYQAAVRPFDQLGLEVAAIAAAGADVRLPGGAIVEQRPLPPAFATFFAALCDRAGWVATLATPKLAYRRADELPAWAANAPEWLRPVTHLRDARLDPLLSVLAELHDGDGRLAELQPWAAQLAMYDALSYTGTSLLTITAAGVDKGTALLALCRATNTNPADAVAIGDSDVDLPMFAVAGRSIAMANATDAVKAAATTVTASADDDGVAQALAAL